MGPLLHVELFAVLKDEACPGHFVPDNSQDVLNPWGNSVEYSAVIRMRRYMQSVLGM